MEGEESWGRVGKVEGRIGKVGKWEEKVWKKVGVTAAGY